MTKLRPPLTFENALTKVAGTIGWARTAEIVGFAERTVRNWSEPDTTASITLEAAWKLDVAFLEAGGDTPPFLHCYAKRVDLEALAATGGREALIAGAALAARESGEAVSATLAAAHPNATPADFAIAEREIEQAIEAKTSMLAHVRQLIRNVTGRGDPVRAPEVAQADTS